MRKYLFLTAILSAICLLGSAQNLFQTKTATNLNNLANFRQAFGDQNYPKALAEDVTADDGVYASTAKLPGAKDSSGPFRFNQFSSLALQGFGFDIPNDATIVNIAVKVRRFKQGQPPIGDYFLSVMQSYSGNPTNGVTTYGAMWRIGDDYPGSQYPSTETEYIFSQSGGGNNGGYDHDQVYAWTPAMINVPYFGVRIDSYPAIGHGAAKVYYDLVEVTVEYSVPAPVTSRSSNVAETIPLKTPVVFPNPFATKTNIQFTAAQSGNAVAELYNINGSKVRSLFSGHVDQGQIYNIAVGDAQLPKGVYIYAIRNGKQQQIGRIIKLQ